MALVNHQMSHGGDIEGFAREFGRAPLDFSANVSPLGTPEPVKQAIANCVDGLADYPDPLNRNLVEAIAAAEGVPTSMVACGNGSSDLIYRLALACRPERALVCAPTFGEYEAGLEIAGCGIDYYVLQESRGFTLDGGIRSFITPLTGLVFLCQPNNPTGLTVSRDLVEGILARCEEMDSYLVIDECFIDFLDDPAEITATGLLAGHPRLVILKAFTKIYGMAGVRLGYLLCSDAELLSKLAANGQPWGVSTIAQQAGIAALGCEGYVEQVREVVKAERAYLKEGLSKLGIFAQGSANFLFFKLDEDIPFVAEMRKRGILVRDCSNYVSLRHGFYRIAVKDHESNSALLEAFVNLLGKES